MAIEKMKFLNLVGTLDEENAILQELILAESIHLNLDHSEAYDNSYIMHEYEAMLPAVKEHQQEDYMADESSCQNAKSIVEKIAAELGIELEFDHEHVREYSKKRALEDISHLKERLGPNIEAINEKQKEIRSIEALNEHLEYIGKSINFTVLNNLNYFEYEIGTLSRDSRLHVKKNYENISALIFEIGEIEDSKEDIYIVLYLKSLKDETLKILKSLNWNKLDFDTSMNGDISNCKEENKARLKVLHKQIERLEKDIFENKSDTISCLNKIYTRVCLELKIIEMKREVFKGSSVFVLSAWIRARDCSKLEKKLSAITDKYVMAIKDPEELGKDVTPPTLLRNNSFFRPFELIVKLYGLPKYNEIDPTPFLAITFCLMFGIMFGDVGQGFVYFLAGFLIAKKMEVASGILKRLGASSMVFGLVYGSVFGLEDIPIIKDIALVQGGPLNGDNIMPILIVGVSFGVAVLTISFLFGIINALRRSDIETAFFGKNGVAGYLFFMGFIITVLCIVQVVKVSVSVPLIVMVITLLMMVLKEPLTHLVLGQRPLISGDKGSYYVESGFEGVETILSTLSNALSFIRVGAFALNHAGLFLAFAKMAEMMEGNIIAQMLILVLGNILILTLEGLVVFIQGLRLQYYEMFSKYFGGDGIMYDPLKIK